jgi:hypothetical protein
MEIVLQYLDQEGQFERLLSRLRDDTRSRNSTLAEARAARFLHGLGFQILQWEPPSVTGCPGDLLAQMEDPTPIFIEVKAPDWQGELSEDERPQRKTLGKHVDAEARAVSPIEMPFQVIRNNALKKFTDDQPNLVVIVDDLFDSPASARGVIEGYVDEFFHDPETARVGGILFLCPQCPVGRPVSYSSNFYHNPAALDRCRLPKAVITILSNRAEQDAAT